MRYCDEDDAFAEVLHDNRNKEREVVASWLLRETGDQGW
jgi:hypothetical protein